MRTVPLHHLISYIDELLQVDLVADWPEACNGLQVENSGKVRLIAGAVDVNPTTIQAAISKGANLLIVHHGLFWTKRIPWTSTTYKLMLLFVKNDLALYSAHLPLDLHPTFGNNAQLCSRLGFEKIEPCLYDSTRKLNLGLKCKMKIDRDHLLERVSQRLGVKPNLIPAGPQSCQSIAVVSGSGGPLIFQAAREDIDTLLTGEGPHWTFSAAEELGINIIYAGHYATESLGIQALCEHIAHHFELPWVFVAHPSGL